MTSLVLMIYSGIVYVIFLATFLYAIGFIGNLPLLPKTIDSGPAGPVGTAIVVNGLLLALFAIQHSVMARPAFKRRWTRIVPHSAERTTYVLLASLALMLLLWQWRPLPDVVWSVSNPWGILILNAIFWIGWAVLLISTFLINHFELFGLQQAYVSARGEAMPAPKFRTPLFYKRVRHPLYFGFLLGFWATPQMTVGHLLFALATTGYILLGIFLEERDLVAMFGDEYRRYRREVAMLIPLPGRKAKERAAATVGELKRQ